MPILTVFQRLSFAVLALVAGMALAPGSAGAAGVGVAGPACGAAEAGSCLVDTMAGERLATRVDFERMRLSNRYRNARLRQCCRRWDAGQPLVGYLCSPKYLELAVFLNACTPRRPLPPRLYNWSPVFVY